MNGRLVRNIVSNVVSIENAEKQHCFGACTIVRLLIINSLVCKCMSMLHKHIFGFHKSDFVKCKLLTNLEEKFYSG